MKKIPYFLMVMLCLWMLAGCTEKPSLPAPEATLPAPVFEGTFREESVDPKEFTYEKTEEDLAEERKIQETRKKVLEQVERQKTTKETPIKTTVPSSAPASKEIVPPVNKSEIIYTKPVIEKENKEKINEQVREKIKERTDEKNQERNRESKGIGETNGSGR